MKINVTPIVIKQRLSKWDLIRFQIHAFCNLRHIQITNPDLDMLVLLALTGKTDLTTFCEKVTQTELSTGVRLKKKSGKDVEYKFIFNSLQSARNAIYKATELGLIIRQGKGHIKIWLTPELYINTEDNLLLHYQLLTIASN